MKKLRQNSNGFTFIEVLASLIMVIALLLAGYLVYQSNHKPTHKVAPTSNSLPLMIVKYSGGLCASGNVCSSQYDLYTDGTFQNHTKLTSAEVTQLTKIISKTDFLRYSNNPHPDCPSASDGSDESFMFPQKYPSKTFTICELQIPANDTAIAFINNLIDSHQSK